MLNKMNFKNTGLFLFCFFIATSTLYSEECSLSVKIEGAKNNAGKMQIAVFKKTHKGFPDDKFAFKTLAISVKEKIASFKSLPCGKYAIAVYHDENGNNKLDKTAIDIPKEGYGFSNNPDTSYGPPEYIGAEFELTKEIKEIQINLKYLFD
jgi:uncharacterized protein (DUF2141 family)